MLTTIKFVGLIVTTLVTGPPQGVQLIMGNFPATLPPHMRIISYPPASRVNPNNEWPKNGTYTTVDGTVYDYVLVTLENIAITGPTEPFNNQLGKMPHLTCCCSAFNAGFAPDWGNRNEPPANKRSAYFTFSNGTYTTLEEPTKAISTVLLVTDNVSITFTGTLSGSATKKLVIKPNTNIVVANEPICVLRGVACPPMPGPSDFLNYYRMGIGTQGCTATPMSTPSCAPQLASCPTNPATAKPRTPKLTAVQEKVLSRLQKMYVDINCSDTGWP